MEESSTTNRQPRTQVLDPDLVTHSRTTDWAFSLTSGFKSALDIQCTEIAKNKVKTQVWTQGQNFDFQVGDTIYDTPAARESPWLEALHHIRTCLEVVGARKAEPVNFSAGEVVFRVLHPNVERTALEGTKTYQGSQNDFIALLRTGQWQGTPHAQL